MSEMMPMCEVMSWSNPADVRLIGWAFVDRCVSKSGKRDLRGAGHTGSRELLAILWDRY